MDEPHRGGRTIVLETDLHDDSGRNVARVIQTQAALTYGTMYGMVKTTIYLPDDLKRRVEHAARVRSTSEAEVIRSALDATVPLLERPRPRFPLFASGQPIEDWDEAMRGFGED